MNDKNGVANSDDVDVNDQEEQQQEEDIPFFADATLDLEEAQGIASTPDASQAAHKLLTLTKPEYQIIGGNCPLPQLSSTSFSPHRSTFEKVDKGSENSPTKQQAPPGGIRQGENYSWANNKEQTSPNSSSSTTNHDKDGDQNSTSVRNNPTTDHYHQETVIQGQPLIPHQSLSSSCHQNTTSFSYDFQHPQLNDHRPARPPRRPRDTQWIAWFLFVALPLLLVPAFIGDSVWKQSSNSSSSSTTTTNNIWHHMEKVNIPIIITALVATLIARIFYLSRGGGEGEDRRYFSSQILIVTNMVACFILPVVTLVFYNLPVRGTLLYNSFVLFLAYVSIKDIYIFAKLFRSARIMREGVNDGQRTLFRMLVNSGLDVLCRSLKCHSFYRVVVVVILVQLGIIILIQRAIALVICLDGIVQKLALLVLGVVGYWVTGICIKLLSYLACGGITAWFAQQSALLQELETMKQRRNEHLMKESKERGNNGKSILANDEEKLYTNTMPEAYRSIDASAYSVGIEFDEGIDDDCDDDCDDFSLNPHQHEYSNNTEWISTHNNTLTVKVFLKSALTISFGSILHCALVGGVANFAWSRVRTWENLTASQIRYESVGQGTFQEMDIGRDYDDGSTLQQRLFTLWKKFIIASKCFVRNHNDLALTHVGAYYKSYTRAANDVMSLIVASGKFVLVT